MRIRHLFLILFLFFQAASVRATPQIPDVLMYEGKEYPIYNELLTDYFKKYPSRKPESEGTCSALWRGYVAKFEVSGGLLILKDVTSDSCFSPRPALKIVVPDGKPLVIDWYTGLLISIYGENEADPYSLTWLDSAEKYSLFEIDSGRLGKVKHFTNSEYKNFKNRQFLEYKKTADYQNQVKKMTADGRLNTSAADTNLLMWIFWNTRKFLVD
jgi:hypothetical protein